MLFIILGAFWTIHESVSVVMLSLPSSRASDEEISCTLSYTPRACPNCGVINRGQILKCGFYQAKHKYGQFRAQPLMLLVKTQRFQCPDCHTTFNATNYLFEHQRTIDRKSVV